MFMDCLHALRPHLLITVTGPEPNFFLKTAMLVNLRMTNTMAKGRLHYRVAASMLARFMAEAFVPFKDRRIICR